MFDVPNNFRNFARRMSEQIVKKPRLEWLDALRGFTMILVVSYHVAQYGFEESWKTSSSMSFLMLFRMPLFFFVSGFLAYKASQVWNLRNLGGLLLKKLRVQLVPTVVFFLIATAILYKHFWPALDGGLRSQYKGGYWFTLVLLYMFIIYYPFAWMESKLPRFIPAMAPHRSLSWVPITLLFVISLLVYESCYLPQHFYWAFGYRRAHPMFLWESSIIQLMLYFPFFLYGNIVHRYWDKAQCVMDSRWFFPIIVFMVVFATLDAQKWHTLRMAWAVLPMTLAKFLLLTIAFMYFRHYKDSFTKAKPIGWTLQYIGRRTLDIYLIHFLFMPELPAVGEFFKTFRHNFVIDTSLSIVIGLLVVGFCIVTSNILRISPLFKKWLFGRE